MDNYFSPLRVLPIQFTRGCDWRKCVFCTHHYLYRGVYKPLNLNKVVNWISEFKEKYKTDLFIFNDENFSASRLSKLSDEILKSKLEAFYYAYARPTSVFTKPVLQKMHQAGFRILVWGLESANKRVLDLMNKGTDLSKIPAILENAYDLGISNHLFSMFGFPTETRAGCENTVEFFKKYQKFIDYILLQDFHFDIESPLGQNHLDYGITEVGVGHPNFKVKEGISPEEAIKFVLDIKKKMLFENLPIRNNRYPIIYQVSDRIRLFDLVAHGFTK